jgi:CRP-like cAMP-binding protein
MDMAQIQRYIEKVELFHGVQPENVVKILAKGTTMVCQKGEVIFYKGTVGSQMYVVLGGTVGVFDGDKCLAKLGVGDMFGEMALVNKEPRSATVAAIENSHLFMLTETTFQHLLTKHVAIQLLMNIIATLSKRLKTSNQRAVD